MKQRTVENMSFRIQMVYVVVKETMKARGVPNTITLIEDAYCAESTVRCCIQKHIIILSVL